MKHPACKENIPMKRVLLFLLCALFLASCARKPAADLSAASSPADAEPQVILVYYGDENAEKLLSSQVQVDEINAETILSHLCSAHVLPEGIAVNKLEKDGTRLMIDFNPSFGDFLCAQGTSGEYIAIGSMVNTFLSAYNAYSLVFTVDGEILESGHVIYDFPLEFME